ncbi:MAG TPA: GGDEF domain-containing protein [Gemmatimonadaceae bacterium]|nr:GGDEF domain-containing protein [Gemmatimonadaceae bacterium]
MALLLNVLALQLSVEKLSVRRIWLSLATVLILYLAIAVRGDQAFVAQRLASLAVFALVAVTRVLLHMRVHVMVRTDLVGGCLNRRGFEEEYAAAVSGAAQGGGRSLALIAIDVDHFKSVNDTHGHLAGDDVLRELGQLLVASVRGNDRVGRVGGEEFLVLLPDGDIQVAASLAERLRRRVEKHAFSTLPPATKVTISAGIAAERVTDDYSGSQLRARADAALYQAKRAGRDRVRLWAPGIRSNTTPPYQQQAAGTP